MGTMHERKVELGWPLALLGAVIGWALPTHSPGVVTIALVLGLYGALVATLLERVRDWQVALLSPAVAGLTGATIGGLFGGAPAAAVGATAGIGFGLMALPPMVLMTDAARRASLRSSRPGS